MGGTAGVGGAGGWNVVQIVTGGGRVRGAGATADTATRKAVHASVEAPHLTVRGAMVVHN